MLPSTEHSSEHRRHNRHPLTTTAFGLVFGLIIISFFIYIIYNSGNHVSDCQRPLIYPLYYLNGSFDTNTLVSLCFKQENLYIQWEINDKNIISQYENCHDPIYKSDSVGVMLVSPLYRYVNNYYSFIISPKGLVYSEDISPYYKIHSHIFDCEQIQANITMKQNGWLATLQIPIQKIGKGNILATQIKNFFRIDVNQKNQKVVSLNDKQQKQIIRNYVEERQSSKILSLNQQNLKIEIQ